MMRMFGVLLMLMLSLGGCGVESDADLPAQGKKPVRVLSMNQCTDQILLMLLPPERITSVSWLSRDPANSLMLEKAQAVATNHGTVEDVLRQQPDLVVLGSFNPMATRSALDRLGYPTLLVDHANSLDDIRAVTRQIAQAVGEPQRGEELIAQMNADLIALETEPTLEVQVAAWDSDGFAGQPGTLFGTMLTLAGVTNVAQSGEIGATDIEVLLRTQPDVLLRRGEQYSEPSLRSQAIHHPVIEKIWGNDRIVPMHPADTMCGTPFIGQSIRRLRKRIAKAETQSNAGNHASVVTAK